MKIQGSGGGGGELHELLENPQWLEAHQGWGLCWSHTNGLQCIYILLLISTNFPCEEGDVLPFLGLTQKEKVVFMASMLVYKIIFKPHKKATPTKQTNKKPAVTIPSKCP